MPLTTFQLFSAIEDAIQIIGGLPATELGACYVDNSGVSIKLVSGNDDRRIHFGSLYGAWPRIC